VLSVAFFDISEKPKKTAFRDDHARYSGRSPKPGSARISKSALAIGRCKSRIIPEEMFPFRCNR